MYMLQNHVSGLGLISTYMLTISRNFHSQFWFPHELLGIETLIMTQVTVEWARVYTEFNRKFEFKKEPVRNIFVKVDKKKIQFQPVSCRNHFHGKTYFTRCMGKETCPFSYHPAGPKRRFHQVLIQFLASMYLIVFIWIEIWFVIQIK